MRGRVSKAWVVVATIASCESGDTDGARRCAVAMFDSLDAEYPTVGQPTECMPGVGDETAEALNLDTECPAQPDAAGVLFAWGRFFYACPACGAGTEFHLCRPLVCEDDSQCPWFPNIEIDEVFECRNGICQSADLENHPVDELSVDDAQLMCQAHLERGAPYTGPDPCPGGEPCELPLPEPCLQP